MASKPFGRRSQFHPPARNALRRGTSNKNRFSFFLSVSSLLGVGSELESQLVISNWLKPTDSILDEGVWAPLFLAFQRLAEGVGEDGKPLCQDPNGGPCWNGLWCFHFSDMEFLANNLGMRGGPPTTAFALGAGLSGAQGPLLPS